MKIIKCHMKKRALKCKIWILLQCFQLQFLGGSSCVPPIQPALTLQISGWSRSFSWEIWYEISSTLVVYTCSIHIYLYILVDCGDNWSYEALLSLVEKLTIVYSSGTNCSIDWRDFSLICSKSLEDLMIPLDFEGLRTITKALIHIFISSFHDFLLMTVDFSKIGNYFLSKIVGALSSNV